MGETMSEALCPVLGSPVATLRILQLVYWSVKGLPHPDVHLFISQSRRVRLHFGSSGSLTNGSNHAQEENGENYFCSKKIKYIEGSCNTAVINTTGLVWISQMLFH